MPLTVTSNCNSSRETQVLKYKSRIMQESDRTYQALQELERRLESVLTKQPKTEQEPNQPPEVLCEHAQFLKTEYEKIREIADQITSMLGRLEI